MSDVFAPPDGAPELDPHVLAISIVLLVLAAFCLLSFGLVGVAAVATMLAPHHPNDPPAAVMGAVFLCEGSFLLIPTAAYGAIALGLIRGNKWAWVGGLVVFGMMLGGCGLPLGLYAYWALLRESTRVRYGWAVPSTPG